MLEPSFEELLEAKRLVENRMTAVPNMKLDSIYGWGIKLPGESLQYTEIGKDVVSQTLRNGTIWRQTVTRACSCITLVSLGEMCPKYYGTSWYIMALVLVVRLPLWSGSILSQQGNNPFTNSTPRNFLFSD